MFEEQGDKEKALQVNYLCIEDRKQNTVKKKNACGKKGSCILGSLLAIFPISKFFFYKDRKNTQTSVWSLKKKNYH